MALHLQVLSKLANPSKRLTTWKRNNQTKITTFTFEIGGIARFFLAIHHLDMTITCAKLFLKNPSMHKAITARTRMVAY